MRELFGLKDEDKVFIKLFSSAIRGDTPASAIAQCEPDTGHDALGVDPVSTDKEHDQMAEAVIEWIEERDPEFFRSEDSSAYFSMDLK